MKRIIVIAVLSLFDTISYAQSFSGWTDAAEMEADLRNVRDGYHLAN